ncbi:class A beta-lactamase [Kosakonia cowanii]|uniref:class A beta-lactamase n=1 Tax=Kosakonia cowanii TaxID=208223 RepID=UPI0028A1C8EC|nr:class A beta-lactamase [Kosakonia cowanii]
MNAYKERISGIVLLAATGCSLSAHAAFDQQTLQKKIEMLENKSGGKLGLTVVDTSDGTTYSWRGDEKFPLCSTSKVMVVAAILKKSESDTNLLAKKITINKSDMVNYNPITSKYIDSSMTITELSKAALQYSDNAAMNKLLSYLGGPRYATQFARTIGDKAYSLDRNEPGLNTAIPSDSRDTTTPSAMAETLNKLILGSALKKEQKAKLTEWMKGNTTGLNSIKAGLPAEWTVADKTGSGDYGTTNDVAVIWPKNHAPVILTTYFTQPEKDASARKDVLASAAKLIAEAISN